MELTATNPVNVRVLQYEGQNVRLLLNGNAQAELALFVGAGHVAKRSEGARDIVDGVLYRVTVGGRTMDVFERDGTVTVPLSLSGQTEVVVERAP